jgi:hypothetical protein
LTRLGGVFGIFLTLNYMSARGGLDTFNAWSSVDACMMLLSAINLVLPTGRVFGIDRFFMRRSAPKAPVVAEFVPERPLDRPAAPPPQVGKSELDHEEHRVVHGPLESHHTALHEGRRPFDFRVVD